MRLMNPTNGKIRNDKGGLGTYGARRRKAGQIYLHRGTDYACIPGQNVLSPCTGRVERTAKPYAGDDSYSGLLIQSKRMALKVFYVLPREEIIGKIVKAGESLGTAQDISLKYPGSGVTPHIHVEIVSCDPEIFMKGE